ncbi:lantibiotic modifying-like protein [Streptosporangiaceae bacterium NEAU-GS5]|nr:lantibiotic modifying-like protein [Streptosporangiaceae bacterium NEAU-GS5]
MGTDDLLAAAVGTARWVTSAAVDGSAGRAAGGSADGPTGEPSIRHWQANPDPGGRSARAGDASSLYAGAAGIVLFLLELADATGDDSYRADALAGARYLAAGWADQADLTLHHGLAGHVFAMAEAAWATGDDQVEAAARAAADRIVRGVRSIEGAGDIGIGWTGDPALRGDGGIVLALLHAAGMLGVAEYEQVAIEAGERIAALAVPGHTFGGDSCADFPTDAVTPGFLPGTAGSAFLLARLYGITGDDRFLTAARRGADFVRAVSVVTDRCALIPHHVPQGRELHYLGYCSGSAGVARTFHELHRVTGDPGDLDWVERLAHGIVQSGAPERRSAGYWNVACQCCGTAGLIELFTGLWSATGQRSHLDFAQTLAGDLLAHATGDDHLRWYQAYRRLRPREVAADTGYMVGAAGIGAALLHLEAALRALEPGAEEARRLILLPDNPFPAIPLPPAPVA